MTPPPIPVGSDGLFHPANEDQVIALVHYAREAGVQIRARGATHSVAWSIYTDPSSDNPRNRTLQQSPPPPKDGKREINIAFDKMRDLKWVDANKGVIEAGPGINLGWDPQEPFGVSTLENSLLYQIFQQGWAVSTLGGITHQTLAGFTATGSAGGSTRFGWDNAIAFKVVDGTGNCEWIEEGHEHFHAYATSMGLLGIVVAVRMQLIKMYNVEGSEQTTPLSGSGAPMDFLGSGSADQPSLEQFLKDTEYTRVVWWPQKGAERIQTWQAKRVDPPKNPDDNVPYQQFTPNYGGQTEQYLGALIFVLVGNTNPGRIIGLIWQKTCAYLENLAFVLRQSEKGEISRFLTFLLGCLTGVVAGAIATVLAFFNAAITAVFPKLLPIFQPMTERGEETTFNDWYWRSLCMDNTVSDELLGTEFTEIWVPIDRTQEVMNIYQTMFEEGGEEATGYFSTEVYGGSPTRGWMHPGYSDGADEYANGAVRIDVYWYRDNDGIPNDDEGFLDQYWDILKQNNIPFRLHWGKFIPRDSLPFWAKYYRDNLPRFGDFMDLRAQRDPHDLFFTEYWRTRLTGK
ncbi:hypothetical protein NAP1_09602 [Erythrobacter sp. NAP1]|uniref:FAD-binding oxidoreductase n=1 Tax=Erythrobacter sp. NAP1 TaxID=237727 RepID=UPI000068519D|nr:FAD-dependent oxidoreductase [Erythrobacter sp. NAP1]EAQ27839.1 hypothetical protein NAP1_09602 [Erythrobacter sp. NAP1]